MSERVTMIALLLITLGFLVGLFLIVYYDQEREYQVKGPEHFVLLAISPEGCKVYMVSGIHGNITACK